MQFKYYGLYTEIEQPNKAYLEARGLSSSGSMYKARNFSFHLDDALKDVDDSEYSEEEFETVLTIREATDHNLTVYMMKFWKIMKLFVLQFLILFQCMYQNRCRRSVNSCNDRAYAW